MENMDYFEELTDDEDFLEMIREVEEGLFTYFYITFTLLRFYTWF